MYFNPEYARREPVRRVRTSCCTYVCIQTHDTTNMFHLNVDIKLFSKWLKTISKLKRVVDLVTKESVGTLKETHVKEKAYAKALTYLKL